MEDSQTTQKITIKECTRIQTMRATDNLLPRAGTLSLPHMVLSWPVIVCPCAVPVSVQTWRWLPAAIA